MLGRFDTTHTLNALLYIFISVASYLLKYIKILHVFLVVFRILDFFLTDSALFLKHMILVSFSSFQEYLVFLTGSALF